jgi:hypothetical protein
MKFTSNVLLAASLLCLMACSEGKKKNTSVPQMPAANQNTITPSANIPAAGSLELQTLPTAETNSAVALNPPHGEPGHRCEIEVGAPLNSAPAATNAAPASTPVPTFNPPPSFTTPSAQSTTGAGLNPPHGQPGHDCAVAVGAPLPKK